MVRVAEPQLAETTVEQTATALGLSTASVTRGWAMAQAWLRAQLGDALAS